MQVEKQKSTKILAGQSLLGGKYSRSCLREKEGMLHVSTCGAWLRLSLVRGVDTDKDEKERKGKTGKGKENIIWAKVVRKERRIG